MKKWKRIIPLALALLLLAGCAESAVIPEDRVTAEYDESAYLDTVQIEELDLAGETVALAGAPALPLQLMPEASGTKVSRNSKAMVDYSNTADGYVMVKFTATTTKQLKVKVINPAATEYTYNLNQGEWTTFPLSDGNGAYRVKVFEKKSDDPKDYKYATVLNTSFDVTLTDEFAPFLRPNQYVNYEVAEDTIAKAQELAGNEKDPLKKVEKIYSYVVKNFTYDKQRAADVQAGKLTGYLPVLDSVLAEQKGICFDYAAVMTGMLRSQGVPCKLMVGYAGTVYHAWVSVWSEETGWVEGAIYFDGEAWHRMDPTFASNGNSADWIMKYIGDGSNYNSRFIY